MKLYRALLHLYPTSFRAEYGDEMCAIFEQRRRDAPWLYVTAFFEILFNAIAVHFDVLRQDLRYASRSFLRAPGFTITAIAVAALGIGATTAAFTMVDHVLIRPLPFPNQDRLVKIFEDHSFGAGEYGHDWDVSPANFRDFKSMSTSFENMGAFHAVSMNWTGPSEPRRIEGESVTSDVFPVLGVKPMMGRIFTAAEDREGAPGTVVLSYRLWQREFGGDASALGRKMILDDHPYTIIGVMPSTFYFRRRDRDFWITARFGPENYVDRTDTYYYGVGKLKPDVSIAQARVEMSTIAARLQQSYPKEMAHVGATVLTLRDDPGSQNQSLLMVLLAASLCVLLVACTNLASLLMARALHRRKELAVRAALGAGRERLVRQLLTESLIIAMLGGALGLIFAFSAIPLLVRLVPVNLPIAEAPPVDARVLLFAFALTILTGIAFGVLPALRVSRRQDGAGLRETSRAGGGRRERLRSALVIAEVAGAVVLLTSCGLLTRAMWRVQSTDPGFRAEGTLVLRTSLPLPKYEQRPAREMFYAKVLSQAQHLPGVTGAAYISFMPLEHGGGVWPVEVEGQPRELSARENASLRFVTPGYFALMGIPMLNGRDVLESDTMSAPFVAVVSESFVRRYWPRQNPIGRRINFGNYDRTIAGIVGDVHVRGLENASEPQVYLPYKQHDRVSLSYAPQDLAVHVSANPAALAPALRHIIREADPAQPITSVRLLSDIVEEQTGSRRVQVGALGAFAIIAFLLAAIGIHGLLAFAVTNRTQEIGVRMALGAGARDILSMILGEGMVLSVVGISIGSVLAYGAGRGLQSLLAGVAPGDFATFAAVIGLCVVMTIAGSLAPAMRAVRIDPTVAIRSE